MKKLFFILLSLFFISFELCAMEGQQEEYQKESRKRKEPEKEKEQEQENVCQQLRIKRRRTTVPSLRQIAAEKIAEIAPEIEELSEFIESIPEEELKHEIREAAQQELPFAPTRLHNAQTEKEIETALTLGFDPNIKDRSGKTAINSLIYNEHDNEALHLINLINEKGGLLNLDVSTPDNDVFTPLQRAILHKNLELAKRIISILQKQNKLDSINNINNQKESALTLAIQHLPELVELLIKLGANPNTTSYWTCPYSKKINSITTSQAAAIAINNNNANALKLLINAGAIIPLGSRNRVMREKDKYPELWEIVNEYIQRKK